jgi:hypothetical protein
MTKREESGYGTRSRGEKKEDDEGSGKGIRPSETNTRGKYRRYTVHSEGASIRRGSRLTNVACNGMSGVWASRGGPLGRKIQ